MDQGLKERLVGAAVLVAIAVWLIPWVLDGPEGGVESAGTSLELPAAEEPVPMRTQTLRLGDPPEPSVPPPAAAVEPANTAQAARAEPEPSKESDLPADPPAAAAEPAVASVPREGEQPAAAAVTPAPKPAASTSPAAGDWAVQLGSFGEEANARRLAQRAGTFGYKAEVTPYSDRGRTLYRVRVGPQRTRAEADAVASALRVHGIADARVVEAR
jgi:DedD protein